jgi:hypothetical protein
MKKRNNPKVEAMKERSLIVENDRKNLHTPKYYLNEQEESVKITSIDVGGEITDSTDKKSVNVLGVMGCKNCESPNGSYTVNGVRYDKSKVEEAIGDTTEIVIFDNSKKEIYRERYPKSKGLTINFNIPKDKFKKGNYFIVVEKDKKQLAFQQVKYEPLFGDDPDWLKDDPFFNQNDDNSSLEDDVNRLKNKLK